MNFIKYQHVERIGREECEGVLNGTVYVEPKIDGTNSCVWLENNKVHAGSRTRELSLENDNDNFYKEILQNENIKKYLFDHPNRILYGEYLIKHTIKYYKDDAWKKFYVFDILEVNGDDSHYIPYDEYSKELEQYHITYIPLLAKIENPTIEDLSKLLKENHYLLKDGDYIGEGIVCKNYNYKNKYGRVVWGKIVADEFFKTKSLLRQKNHEIKESEFENRIAYEYISDAVIEKEYAKLKLEFPEAKQNEMIGKLLSSVFDTFITEDLVTVVRKYKNCKIDFRVLKKASDNRCKEVLKDELF